MQTLPSVTPLRATSAQGSADILIDFDLKTDPRVDLVAPNAEPVVSYGLTSQVLLQTALRQFVDSRSSHGCRPTFSW